jgi:hypothetical protein
VAHHYGASVVGIAIGFIPERSHQGMLLHAVYEPAHQEIMADFLPRVGRANGTSEEEVRSGGGPSFAGSAWTIRGDSRGVCLSKPLELQGC